MKDSTAKETETNILNAQTIWENAVPKIIETNPKFNNYSSIIHFAGNSDGKLRIAVPNKFALGRLNNLLQDIQNVVTEISQGTLEVELDINEELCKSKNNKQTEITDASTQAHQPAYSSTPVNSFYIPRLDEAYTFEGFATSPENAEAVQFAKMFASKDAVPFKRNLYIFGPYGLGKTHLSQACAKLAQENGMTSQWVSAEQLKNLWVRVYKESRFDDFNSVFLKKDLLIVDNAQALQGGKGTQKKLLEMLHLYSQEGRRVIITSYLDPTEMRKTKGIHENLKSLFLGGLNAQIRNPSLETRIEILKKKAELFGVEKIDESVLTYMATRLDKEVRQLEAGMANLIAHAQALNTNYSLKLAETIVGNLIGPQDVLNEEYIKRVVCNSYGISLTDIESNKRPAKIAKPRQIAFFLIRQHLQTPLQEIGKYFGNKQHGTVSHGINLIEEKLNTSTSFRKEIDYIVKQLGLPVKEHVAQKNTYKPTIATQADLFSKPKPMKF